MPEPKPIAFVPKWLRGADADEFDGPVAFGSVPDQSPRIVTRLVPKDHGMSLPARVVSRVIDLKQSLALYAARDVVEGYNPSFADLRSLSGPLVKLAALSVEPSEAGSYVIPARLDAEPLAGAPGADADAVAKRFTELLAATDDPARAVAVSVGALQACQELGKLLRRDVETIEVSAYDRGNAPLPGYALTPAKAVRIDAVLRSRRSTEHEFEVVTGVLDALDIGKNEFHLRVAGRADRVKGTAAFISIASLRGRLGEPVSFEGLVVRQGRKMTLTAFNVVESDAPADVPL